MGKSFRSHFTHAVNDRIGNFYENERGIAAVEFALIAPVLILVLIAVVELASVISSRMAVNSSVSAVANAALLSRNNPFDLQYALDAAQQLKKQRFVTEAVVNLNQAYKANINTTGTFTTEGTSFDLCYCPTKQNGQLDWGLEVECNSSCPDPDQSRAGRFMSVNIKFAPPILFGRLLDREHLGQIDAIVRLD